MGWVTLTLRKKELKVSHAYYQLRDLQISREKRAMARQKQANSTSVNNNKRVELKAQREQWESDKQQVYEDAASNQQTTGNGTNGTNTNGTNANGTNTNTTAKTAIFRISDSVLFVATEVETALPVIALSSPMISRIMGTAAMRLSSSIVTESSAVLSL